MKSALLKATALSAGLAASLTMVGLQPASAAGFSGDYAPDYWSVINLGSATNANSGGFVDETLVPTSVTLVGSNSNPQVPAGPGETYYLTELAGSIASYVSFNYSYGTFDLPNGGFDPFGVVVNNVFTLLADLDGQSGSYTFLVNPGEEFGFGVLTTDNIGGAGFATISNFNVTPVPTPALLPGLIGMGVAALRKKQGEAEESEA